MMVRGLSLAALAALAACTGPNSNWRAAQTYQALGHDPSWTLTIRGDRLKFAGSTPQTLLEFVPPVPQPTAYGRRYATPRLTLDITAKPCNDAMSGVAFTDTVSVVVDGYNFQGCGGKREPLLDL